MKEYEGLHNVLGRQIQKQINGEKSICAEVGIITPDYELSVKRFDTPIPKTDYYISSSLLGASGSVRTTGGGDHEHSVDLGLIFKHEKISPGDNVLVIWAGNDAVVTDVIKSAAEIGGV